MREVAGPSNTAAARKQLGEEMKTSDWIAAGGAVGTWVIAALALWGEWFKSLFPFLRPVLTIEPIGLSEIVEQNNGLNARYYHLRVRNTRPGGIPAAHDVKVLITRVDKEDAAGQPTPVFSETVPLTWVRGEIYPLRRTIGRQHADANLLWVREDGWFQFEPVVRPNHFPKPLQQGSVKFWGTVQVQSVEADSEPRRFKVSWDGQWHEGASEIRKHLVVSLDPPKI